MLFLYRSASHISHELLNLYNGFSLDLLREGIWQQGILLVAPEKCLEPSLQENPLYLFVRCIFLSFP